MDLNFPSHGGNISQEAENLGLRVDQLLDASSSLVPFPLPRHLRGCLKRSLFGTSLRDYPDRTQKTLKEAIALWHAVDSSMVLPGNGAAELFTWAARDASKKGVSALQIPCFGDYERALLCWDGLYFKQTLPVPWSSDAPQDFPFAPNCDVLWITNPHNPTGQLWSRDSIRLLLSRYCLVICDEAFLPLVPGGESQSLISLVVDYPNLVVIRSFTKLFAIAGLRLGYAIGNPKRFQRWQQWRDPWPVNGLAIAAGITLMNDPRFLQSWMHKVQNWVASEGLWLKDKLCNMPGITTYPSASNFVLIEGEESLLEFREQMAMRGVLLRDCRSFEGLGECWLRIGLQNRKGNQRIISEMKKLLI